MIAALLLALQLLQPALCATANGGIVWVEDVDCGEYWEVCRSGDYIEGAKVRACCLLAVPGICRLITDGQSCNAVERHRCDSPVGM